MELGAVTAAIVPAHCSGHQLLAELGERSGSAEGGVEVEVGMEKARAHAIGAVVRDDSSEGTLDPFIGFLEKSFRSLLVRHVNPRLG